MRISVVIPTQNSEETIGECLLSLSKQTYPPHETIVVDGGSADTTPRIVGNMKAVQLIVDKKSNTPGSARNMGAEVATGDILFFCDSDCILDRRVLEYHTKAPEHRDDVSGVMGALRNAHPGNSVSDFVQRQIMVSEWFGNLGEDGTLLLYLNSANFSIDKGCFLEYRFREDLVSSEDTELFLRLKKNGLKILYEPRASVRHHHPRTIEDLFKRYVKYGEGLFQVEKIHGEGFRSHYRILAPVRYLDFQDDRLHEAVFSDNRQLCEGCEFNSLQKCRIAAPQLVNSLLESDLDLHRFMCLAKAVGILKQRTGINPESILLQLHANQSVGVCQRKVK